MKFLRKIHSILIAPALSNLIFWGWNIGFLVIVFFGILPWLVIPIVEAVYGKIIPFDLVLSCVLVVLVPLVCTIIASRKLSSNYLGLMKFFYGVEVPLFGLCILRLFFIREMTFGMFFLLATFFIAISLLFYDMFITKREVAGARSVWSQHVIFGFQNIMLISGVYAGMLVSIYAIPLAWHIIAAVVTTDWWRVVTHIFSDFTMLPVLFFGMLFLLLFYGATCVLFVALPPVFAITHCKTWHRKFVAFRKTQGSKVYINVVVVLALWMSVFYFSTVQPQRQALKFLFDKPNTVEDVKGITDNIELVREALVNQYLNKYRYLSGKEDANVVYHIYHSTSAFPNAMARGVNSLHNFLLSPLLFDGPRYATQEAGEQYATIFDIPIQKAEQESILSALQATYDRDGLEAGLLNINGKKVLLKKQQVTVDDHGDYADVELFEIYENQTADEQEVFYYFSLPEDAAITGLWMGDSPEKSEAARYVTSPRGAAQKVYNNELARRIDPALLEQTGPQQYRLRVSPIPPKNVSIDGGVDGKLSQQDRIHLWMTYTTLRHQEGFQLPQLTEKRNVFWSDDSVRKIGGQIVDGEGWLPAYVPSKVQGALTEHDVFLKEGFQVHIRPKTISTDLLKRVAVVIDTSYSMKDQIRFALQQAQDGFSASSKDIYLISSLAQESKLVDADVGSVDCYGYLSLSGIINQFEQVRNEKKYDAVFILTDEGSYELLSDKELVAEVSYPVWLVHLGGVPSAYSDSVLDLIRRTRGGVINNSALLLSADDYVSRASIKQHANILQSNYYEWEVKETSFLDEGESGLSPIAAHMVIGSSTENVSTIQLDSLHKMAIQHHIVSPYSSMLVLVNDRQKRDLKEASEASDRFEREVEDGMETPSRPASLFTMTAVPEPHEWALIIIALIMLFFFWKREKESRDC